MRPLIAIAAFVALPFLGFAAPDSAAPARVAFGSCAHQDSPQPIWETVARAEPELWIWLGDNIYGDTADPAILAEKYARQRAGEGYAKLRARCAVVGTWDDHDFGVNDGGKEFPAKVASQQAFLDFLDEPADSARRKQEGVYWSHEYGEGARRLKVILLDARYHRDAPGEPGGDVLGAAQRAWLERELEANEAAVTLIASGIQVLSEDHRYESWARFPEARRWLLDLIERTGSRGVVLLSGDRHISEISALPIEGAETPLYDITSSSLTHAWTTFPGELNRHRVGEVVSENSFGLIEIDWDARVMLASIRNEPGETKLEQRIAF